nr:hypothetical protein C1892_13470 [Pseudomonas sp. MPBD7-1]
MMQADLPLSRASPLPQRDWGRRPLALNPAAALCHVDRIQPFGGLLRSPAGASALATMDFIATRNFPHHKESAWLD